MNARGTRLVQRVYDGCLILYPRYFREANGKFMRHSVAEALADPGTRPFAFCRLLLADLIQSCVKERCAMLAQKLRRHPVVAHALGLGLILSFLGGLGMTTMQQLLRRGADQPQAQMVELGASRLASGEAPDVVIPPGYIEIGRDQQPFLIYYDDHGTPRHGTGYLDQALPAPPAGVFDYVRTHPVHALTWQPRHSIRIAAVLRRIEAPHAGFLLAGRDMALVEKQESLLYHLSIVSWLIVLSLLAIGASLLSRHSQSRIEPMAE